MSDSLYLGESPGGRWSVLVDKEHCLGETTTWIHVFSIHPWEPFQAPVEKAFDDDEGAAPDNVTLIDVEVDKVYFTQDGDWLFSLERSTPEVYYIPTGAQCIREGDHWVPKPGKNLPGPCCPANPPDLICLESLLRPA